MSENQVGTGLLGEPSFVAANKAIQGTLANLGFAVLPTTFTLAVLLKFNEAFDGNVNTLMDLGLDTVAHKGAKLEVLAAANTLRAILGDGAAENNIDETIQGNFAGKMVLVHLIVDAVGGKATIFLNGISPTGQQAFVGPISWPALTAKFGILANKDATTGTSAQLAIEGFGIDNHAWTAIEVSQHFQAVVAAGAMVQMPLGGIAATTRQLVQAYSLTGNPLSQTGGVWVPIIGDTTKTFTVASQLLNQGTNNPIFA